MKKVHSILVTTKFCMCKAATKGKKNSETLHKQKTQAWKNSQLLPVNQSLYKKKGPSSSNLNSKSNFRHRTAIFSNEQIF